MTMWRDPSLVPLSHQHHNGLALVVLAERALAQDSGPEAIAAQARKVVNRYEIELRNHFDLEEQILFPAIREHIGELPLVEALLAEHRRLEQLVAALRDDPSLAQLQDFLSLLRAHIRKEENELFPDIQERLPREVLKLVGVELDARTVRVCME
jgi:hemerythrin-like domain-containing protein